MCNNYKRALISSFIVSWEFICGIYNVWNVYEKNTAMVCVVLHKNFENRDARKVLKHKDKYKKIVELFKKSYRFSRSLGSVYWNLTVLGGGGSFLTYCVEFSDSE